MLNKETCQGSCCTCDTATLVPSRSSWFCQTVGRYGIEQYMSVGLEELDEVTPEVSWAEGSALWKL
mgnify:CR=1 FL=1|jgi:hypothetical protein